MYTCKKLVHKPGEIEVNRVLVGLDLGPLSSVSVSVTKEGGPRVELNGRVCGRRVHLFALQASFRKDAFVVTDVVFKQTLTKSGALALRDSWHR